MNPVINSHRSMKEFANSWALVDRRANVWERREKVDVIEKSITESCRRRWTISADVVENGLQIG